MSANGHEIEENGLLCGHIIRHSTLQHALIEGKVEGSHSRGRPRTMWMGNMTEGSGLGYVSRQHGKQKTSTCIQPNNGWNLAMTRRIEFEALVQCM